MQATFFCSKNPATLIIMWYVYILSCADGTLYTGSTNDIAKRLHAHNHAKSGAHYTKIRRPVALVYKEECETMGEARRREAEIKQMTRTQKQNLFK
jgi:putative endonuclease